MSHQERERVPAGATYRVQMSLSFTFRDLQARVQYLRDLGITSVYSSPILQARAGSTHGYDVVDPSRLNPELGTGSDFDDLDTALREAGLGLLLDIVPNHMAASTQNPWWMDVLRQGPESPFATFFDVDWSAEHSRGDLRNTILLPVLGRPYGDVLEEQEIQLAWEDGSFVVTYYDRRLPLNFRSYVRILHEVLGRLHRSEGSDDLTRQIESILMNLNEWATQHTEAPSRTEIRQLHKRIAALHEGHDEFRRQLGAVLDLLNGRKGDPGSFDELDTILEEQSYRLSFWRNAAEEINYRRFFDISDLISMRVHDPEVFRAMHELVLGLIARGSVTGVRIDHIDGLYDPVDYLDRLVEEVGKRRPGRSTLVVTEKILGEEEATPETFRARGTTGYDFLRALDRLFVDVEGFEQLDARFRKVRGSEAGFDEVANAAKVGVMEDLFLGELRKFTRRLAELSAADRHARDLTTSELRAAITAFVASVEVYRTYIRDDEIAEGDRRWIQRACDDAEPRLRESGARAALAFLRRVTTLDTDDFGARTNWRRFVMRLQQFTGPVTAKGVEDTALYVYTPLVSLCEVGNDPVLPPDALDRFHEMNRDRLAITPDTLNATSTHDTKRGEDTRCRIHALSELAEEWTSQVEQWRAAHAPLRRKVDGVEAPSAEEEWLIYQTLAGVWPLRPADRKGLRSRIREYLTKAMREAKVRTSWTAVNAAWEKEVLRFADAVLASEELGASMEAMQKKIAFPGALNSLASVVLKIASPGIPDIYQGSELWSFSLVDPDNRRPVDYRRRESLLRAMVWEWEKAEGSPEGYLATLREHWRDGRIKLWTTWRALRTRAEHAELFHRGDYIALETQGQFARHLCAFARRQGDQWAVAIAPLRLLRDVEGERHPIGAEFWGDTRVVLPEGAPRSWTCGLTGGTLETESHEGSSTLPTATALSIFPTTLLT
jgi:(1->4)-alpha-D-glucan 1-alpha-D-glucosylmutase